MHRIFFYRISVVPHILLTCIFLMYIFLTPAWPTLAKQTLSSHDAVRQRAPGGPLHGRVFFQIFGPDDISYDCINMF